MTKRRLIVAWKVSTLKLSMASLRYRAMLPVLALDDCDVESKVFVDVGQRTLDSVDVLVIVKSFTTADYWLAQQAAERGIPVIFDLCDNIFIEEYRAKDGTTPSEVFLLIAAIAHAVVVTTEPLAAEVRARVGSELQVFIIPDGIETPDLLSAAAARLKEQRARYNLRRAGKMLEVGRQMHAACTSLASAKFWRRVFHKIKGTTVRYFTIRFWLKLAYRYYDLGRSKYRAISGNPRKPTTTAEEVVAVRPIASSAAAAPLERSSARRILWFGNHGASHANFGMLDLLLVRETLELIASEQEVELVVVSNNRQKYEEHISPLRIPSRYIEWTANSMNELLRTADVVIIPNSRDTFSLGKSANRTVLALSQGVPVVATSTPALMPLAECIVLDDFLGGVRRYLNDEAYRQMHVARAKILIEELYGQPAVARAWMAVIDSVMRGEVRTRDNEAPELIVALHLPQDLDLAWPVLEAARKRGIACAVWTSTDALKRWPQIVHAIQGFSGSRRVLLHDLKDLGEQSFPASVKALLTVSETNLKPHRFTWALTRHANEAGIFTATMQHGFENVGLSYSDEVHDIRQIEISARRIYTWGGQETWHPDIPPQTRERCLPVGCTKPAKVPQSALEGILPPARAVIGIFENLHWHRYSQHYRDFFLDAIVGIAHAYPDVAFLVKPHNAGMWLTARYDGERPEAPNLLIVDPQDPRWASVTAPQMLAGLDAVITSPSTVALDAARFGLPVAVVGYDLLLNNYAPLTVVRQDGDCGNFVRAVLEEGASGLRSTSAAFVERVMLAGDASSRILDDIQAHQNNKERRYAA